MSSNGQKEQWGSRYALIVAAISMAVGTGNIWRFPRVVAAWGGGAFLIAITVALFLWAIPLLMAELLMGYRSRLACPGAFRDFMGKKYTWVGAWMALVCCGLTFYYSVVCGWSLRYFLYALTGSITPGIDGYAFWNAFLANPVETIGFHFLAVLIVFLIVYRGIKSGLEGVLKVMLPSLFVVLIILGIRAATLPGAAEGLRYLFVPDWSLLTSGRVWLEAFTQVAWSTGAGWGLLLVYATYAREKEDIGLNSAIIGFSDTLAAILAAIVVLCTVFAVSPSIEYAHEALGAGNVGLTFIYVVELLADMPGAVVVAPLFFLALALAGITTFISMIELITAHLMNFGISRQKSAIYGSIACFIFGIPSALSINFLDNQDWVWGVALLISGLLTAIAMMKYGVEKARTQINETSDLHVGRWWSVVMRLMPFMFIFLFGWNVIQSIQWYPDTWWHPFEVFSTGTMIFQWAILFIVVYALNNYFNKKLIAGPMTKKEDIISRDPTFKG